MAKRIRENVEIYIAPDIRGFYDQENPRAFDERDNSFLNPNDIDDKIIIYERQVKDWFLNRASRFLRGDKNGFIVLMICLAYLEGVQQYILGQDSNGRSSEFFRMAMHRIYPNTYTDDNLNDFYSEARCGLFHNGMVRGKIIISQNFPDALDFPDPDNIQVNPRIILKDIKADFSTYLSNLKNIQERQLRNNFNTMFTNI